MAQGLAEPLPFFGRQATQGLAELGKALALFWWELLPLLPAFTELRPLFLG